MNAYLAELIGTAILVLLGNGAVANVVLSRTKGHGAGWIVIAAGWGFGVYVAVLCVAEVSGAHLNPAVTVSLAVARGFEWRQVPGYVIAQMLGGILGAVLVFAFYKLHYDVTDDPDAKLGTFCTAPAIRSSGYNLLCEVIATFVLVYAVLLLTDPSFSLPVQNGPGSQEVKVGLGSLGAVRVGLIVFAIGLSLGGTTGYAINPGEIWGHASRTPSCRFAANATAIGRTPGSPSWVRWPEDCSRPFCFWRSSDAPLPVVRICYDLRRRRMQLTRGSATMLPSRIVSDPGSGTTRRLS